MIGTPVIFNKTNDYVTKGTEYNIPKEEFWEDPYGFIDKLEDEDLKWLLLMEMEAMD